MNWSAHLSKYNAEMDTVFNKNEIEKFENDCLEKVSNLSLIVLIKRRIE